MALYITLCSVSVAIGVFFDLGLRHPWPWQILLALNSHSYTVQLVLYTQLCYAGTFNGGNCPKTVSSRSLSSVLLLYMALGPLFHALIFKINRGALLLSGTIVIIWMAIVYVGHINLLSLVLAYMWGFYFFICVLSYDAEKTDRENFALQNELCLQVDATEKAQVGEKQHLETKRSFIAYIFHEIRKCIF
jgi:hypothetical protein